MEATEATEAIEAMEAIIVRTNFGPHRDICFECKK